MGQVFLGILIFLLSVLLPTMANKQELQAVVQGNGLFTKNLYNILAKKPGNVFFSPISAHAVLAMAYQGSSGETQEAFANSLHIPDIKTTAAGYKDVMDHLNNVPNVQLLMANKIYLLEGKTLKQDFKDVVTKQFLSEVENVNFTDNVNTAKKINTWVEQKTNEKIKDLIKSDTLSKDTRLVLVNAIYFKGNWKYKFNAHRTKPEPFYLNEKDTVEVPMMDQKAKFFYKEDAELDAKVLELPYSNPDVSLVIILPNKKDGIAELEKKLVDTDLTKITEDMYKVTVNVKLPKFKIETTIDLKDPLTEAGLGVIFQKEADFSNILENSEQLYVSQAIQKAFIEVNEEGTEAAAATDNHLSWRKARIEEIEEFPADHAFLVLLKSSPQMEPRRRDRAVLPLFVGRLASPIVN